MSLQEQITSMIKLAFWKMRNAVSEQHSLALVTVAAVLASSIQAASQTPSPPPSYEATIGSLSDPNIIAALVAFVGVIVSAGVSWIVARTTVRLQHTKRQSDLALRISEMVSAKDEDQRRAAMRRFAVAVVKVVEPEKHEEFGKVYFIPMNSRVTVGRDEDNDIVLKDSEYLSRWHCGFISDQRNVWIEDYKSMNGTKVKGQKIQKPRMLESGDEIELGPFRLHFQEIRENTILAQ